MAGSDDGGRAAACAAARDRGNRAYAAGDLAAAAEYYAGALELWEEALAAEPAPKSLEVGQLVRYHARGYFGTVMSCFPLFDEYFLKDLGSDQAIWVGDPGGTLRRFGREELMPVRRELVDLRLAVLQNLAAVALKRELWNETVKWADHALYISGRSPKALMRKGSALLRLNLPGPASDVLATVKEELPGDREVSRLLREAEKMRSPMWICVSGCCGPWGIVCGGPVADSMSQVIPPAIRRAPSDEPAEDPSDEPAKDPSDEPTVAEGAAEDGCSTCSSGSAPSSPRPAKAGAWDFGQLAGAAPSEAGLAAAPAEAAKPPAEVAATAPAKAVVSKGERSAAEGALRAWWIAALLLLPAAVAAALLLGGQGGRPAQ